MSDLSLGMGDSSCVRPHWTAQFSSIWYSAPTEKRQVSSHPFSEEEAAKVLHEKEILVLVGLNQGDAEATAWGCDLTYEYVKINGEYRT